MIEGPFVSWARRAGSHRTRWTGGSKYPWLDAARSAACAWCDQDLGSCRCFDAGGAPVRPAHRIDIAAFLASLPKWCRQCRGPLPCVCGWQETRLGYQRRYTTKSKARGRCGRCTGPAPADGGALCETCRGINRTNQKALRERRESAGLCARCGAADHTSGDHYARIRQTKIDRGACITCGKPRAEARRQCQRCREVDANRTRARRAAARSPRQA